MRIQVLGGCALAATLLTSPIRSQEDPGTIKVDVDVVNVLCAVRDKKGALIGNLAKEDFTVFENGKTQDIKYFNRESDLPLTLGLLVDVSGSQANLIEEERGAAHQFFGQVLRKKDMAFLISFGGEAELLQDFTNSSQLLRAGLEKLRVSGGVGGLHPGPVPTAGQPRGTVMHDAVYLAATDRLQKEVGRKAIVLITDGVDSGSRLRLEQAIEGAQKADAIIYSIQYYDPRAYYGGGGGMVFGGGGMGDSALRKMSEETGGRMFRVDRKHTLQRIFDELQQELRSQYSIGYTSNDPAKGSEYRKLEIRTKDRNLKVQARKGYYAGRS